MSSFKDYSQYYNLLYQDKDYNAEVEYVDTIIKKNTTDAKTILELGCGTGIHATLFAHKGYKVHGIDISDEMLETALSNKKELSEELSNRLIFKKGDIREYRTEEKFDVVISLFHVMSYQITNEDLKRAFKTASIHLKKGGIFIFDCWYGPAVLHQMPSTRVKRLYYNKKHIVRIAEPEMKTETNRVDVNYQLLVLNEDEGVYKEIKETHNMRYLFVPEIINYAETNNLVVCNYEEWLTGNFCTENSWNGCFILKQ